MKWWHWLILELLIIFGTMASIHGNVLLNGTSYPLQILFQIYEFLDGTPVGVEV